MKDKDMAPEMIRPAIALTAAALVTLSCTVAQAEGSPASMATTDSMRTRHVKITVDGGETVYGSLVDGAAARDFVKLLPLKLTLKDYNGTEKISDLPRRLSKAGAAPGHDLSPGDIAYYTPWGNLAIYYRDFGYSDGLVLLGKLDSIPTSFSGPGPIRVTITAQ